MAQPDAPPVPPSPSDSGQDPGPPSPAPARGTSAFAKSWEDASMRKLLCSFPVIGLLLAGCVFFGALGPFVWFFIHLAIVCFALGALALAFRMSLPTRFVVTALIAAAIALTLA